MSFGILDKGLCTSYKEGGEVKSPVIPTLRDNILLYSLPTFVCLSVYAHTCIC